MRTHTQWKKPLAIALISLTMASASVPIVAKGHSGRRSAGDLAVAGRVLEASRHKAAPANASRARELFPSSDSLFLPAVAYLAGARLAASVAVADVNGDDKPDIVVGSEAGTLDLLLGNGDGTFQPAVTVAANDVSSIAVADLNGDGKPDLIFVGPGLVGTVEVMLGNGDGTFAPEVTYGSGGAYSFSVAVADVNGDGKPDVIVANEEGAVFGGLVGVLLGNGDGTLQPAVIYKTGGGDAWSVAVGDVNGDGKPDLVLANVCSETSCSTHGVVSVLLGNGDGTFRTAANYDSGGFQAFSLALADVNHDGKLDVAVVNVASKNVGILLGNGDGTFQTAITYETGGIPGNGTQSIALADVDGDGKVDVIVANCSGSGTCSSLTGMAGVLKGNGDGTFQTAVTYSSAGSSAWAVAVADVNADAQPDLLVVNWCANSSCNSGSVGVLLHSNAQNSSTTSLASSLNPSIYGQKVTLSAIVTSAGKGVSTGAVTFEWSYFGEIFVLGTGTLNSSGLATLTKSALNADTYPITAVYKGDATHLGSTSAVLNQVVLETTSTATLTSSPNPSTLGQAVSFTAKISSPTVIPTGPVTFTAGKTVLGTAQLSGGKATLTISSLAVGSTKVTATYYGDSNIAKSSASVIQTVH